MLKNYTIEDIHKLLINKEISCVKLVQDYFVNINKVDKDINAYLSLFPGCAVKQAEKIDKKIKENTTIPLLAGVPTAIKDNILIQDSDNDKINSNWFLKCTAGSKILEDYKPPYDATVIKKLKMHQAIFMGKTNLDEFALGSSTENSAFFVTRNPHNLSCVPGGSSGGSAAAVASNQCVYALGTDTGGSVRQPASFCGIIGFKPTYGTISRYGIIAFACSLEQIGIFTKTVRDCQLVFNAIKGQDKMDSTTINLKKIDKPTIKKPSKLRIGIPKEYFETGIDIEVKEKIKKTITSLQQTGIKTEEISLPYTKYALATYYIIAPAELSSNLARYDGIKYGHSINKQEFKNFDLQESYHYVRKNNFGPEVKRRIILGTYVLSAGYYKAYYITAQKIRTLIQKNLQESFKKFDLILTPTTPTPAFKIGEKSHDPLSMYLSDIYTVTANITGLPAMSIPCGNNKDNLPIGIQIMADYFQEEKIFFLGKIIEQLQK
jgi:aspartyl-tRNA(Asn)/glutamyl-tRNA(Gln) amidotransferase subunit A